MLVVAPDLLLRWTWNDSNNNNNN